MTGLKKACLAGIVLGVGVLGVRHASSALEASTPADMPADSQFLASGYDVEHNERQGDWVACRLDAAQGTDWCRVTDEVGHVVYQGAYLPVDSSVALAADQLQVIPVDPSRLWVTSPARQSPVPVLPLRSGKVLVPAEDEYALAQRWRADPREYNRVVETGQ